MRSFLAYILLLLVVVPLIVDSTVLFPFITGKALLIRLVVMLVFAIMAGLMWYSSRFREEISSRIVVLRRSPLVWVVCVFVALYVLSAIFAVFPFRALLGNIERAEGMVGMLSFFGVFVGALLVFRQKEWRLFLQLSLIVGAVLAGHALLQFLDGISRPSSYLGNPIYLAQYFLFALFAAFLIIQQSSRRSFWRIAGVVMIPILIGGIFLTETRGVIAGIMLATLIAVAYVLWRIRSRNILGYSAKTWAVVALLVVVGLGGLWYATHSAAFWQNIPGMGRLSNFSFDDPTLKTRLFSIGVAMSAINPANEGISRFLIGWGPENFFIAHNKYYNPLHFRYETKWFDRAHNKLLDVLVMNGVVGLAVYLLLWGVFVWTILKRIRPMMVTSVFLWFGIAYFVQNIFVFDSIATYPLWFFVLAYVVFLTSPKGDSSNLRDVRGARFSAVVISMAAIWYAIVFFAITMPGYLQMRLYSSLINSRNIEVIMDGIDDVLSPYTYVQEDIRSQFLDLARKSVSKDSKLAPLLFKAVNAMEELVEREPYNPRLFIMLGDTYHNIKTVSDDEKIIDRAQRHFEAAARLAPRRQDMEYVVALVNVTQGNTEEALAHAYNLIALDPENKAMPYYYLSVILHRLGPEYYERSLTALGTALDNINLQHIPNPPEVSKQYETYFSYFLDRQDTENLLIVLRRMQVFELLRIKGVEGAIDYVKQGEWEHASGQLGSSPTNFVFPSENMQLLWSKLIQVFRIQDREQFIRLAEDVLEFHTKRVAEFGLLESLVEDERWNSIVIP